MELYSIEAYNGGNLAYNAVVNTIEQAQQEMRDALHDGFSVVITKFIKQGE